MRLATLRIGQSTRAVRVDGDLATEVGDFSDLVELLGADGLNQAALATEPVHDLATARFAPVVVNPAKIFCVALNYREHAAEMGRPAPTYPTVFSKWSQALVGHREAVALPPESKQVDWEGELVVVIGRRARRARGMAAERAIAGYTIMCDTSMRDWQSRTTQHLQGKTWDKATPVGPFMVTPDEFDPEATVTTCVNGQVMQHGQVSDVHFSPVYLVEYLSTIMTLEPGDIIATGTPEGVGHARKPPVYLRAGDKLSVSIDSIGTLENPICSEVV